MGGTRTLEIPKEFLKRGNLAKQVTAVANPVARIPITNNEDKPQTLKIIQNSAQYFIYSIKLIILTWESP